MYKHLMDLAPAQRFVFHYFNQVPAPLHPFIVPALGVLAVALYVWALVLMGRWAESKGQRFWLGFTLGIVNGPIVGSVFVACMHDAAKSSPKAKRRTRRRAVAH